MLVSFILTVLASSMELLTPKTQLKFFGKDLLFQIEEKLLVHCRRESFRRVQLILSHVLVEQCLTVHLHVAEGIRHDLLSRSSSSFVVVASVTRSYGVLQVERLARGLVAIKTWAAWCVID